MKACAGLAMVVAMTMVAAPLYAAEHVTLRNGFDLICDHRTVDGDHVRLYLKPSSEDFVEIRVDEIGSIESAPDFPAVQPPDPSELSVKSTASGATSDVASAKQKIPATKPNLTHDDLHEILASASTAHNLDEDLLASVVKAESGGNRYAVSRTGARGLMQLMPQTAAKLGVNDSFSADQNVRGGTAYLDQLLIHYKDNLALALAAYNAGPAAVEKYHGIPPYRETRAYVARVIHEFNRRVEERRRNASHALAAVAITTP